MKSLCCNTKVIYRHEGNEKDYHSWCECSKCGEKCIQIWGNPEDSTGTT